MKKRLILFYLGMTFLAFSHVFAQTPISNGDLENWQSAGNYETPLPANWWTSLNALSQFSASAVTLTKTTDAFSGTYAARLETKKLGTLLLSGLLTTGSFNLATTSLKNGQPFTDKPTHLKGYYKYTPVNGDSCALAIELSKWKNNSHYIIADASLVTSVPSTQYQAFDLVLNYYDLLEIPDSINIVFSSSAEGDNFQGQVGSTLFIDNISLDYTPTQIQSSVKSSFSIIYPNPTSKDLFIHLDNNTKSVNFLLYDIEGKLLEKTTYSSPDNYIDVTKYKVGMYFYTLENEKGERINGKLNFW